MRAQMRVRSERFVERLARFGYVCKGFVYVVIGLLAAASIVGRGESADRQYAFHFVRARPFGRVVLFVVAIGLAGYAIWRITSGFDDAERHGSDAKGLLIRGGSIVRGISYGWIAIELIRQVMHRGGGGKSSDSQARHWT